MSDPEVVRSAPPKAGMFLWQLLTENDRKHSEASAYDGLLVWQPGESQTRRTSFLILKFRIVIPANTGVDRKSPRYLQIVWSTLRRSYSGCGSGCLVAWAPPVVVKR